MRELPREISAFEMQAFFTFERAEREVIDARRSKFTQVGSGTFCFPIERYAGQILPSQSAAKTTAVR